MSQGTTPDKVAAAVRLSARTLKKKAQTVVQEALQRLLRLQPQRVLELPQAALSGAGIGGQLVSLRIKRQAVFWEVICLCEPFHLMPEAFE